MNKENNIIVKWLVISLILIGLFVSLLFLDLPEPSHDDTNDINLEDIDVDPSTAYEDMILSDEWVDGNAESKIILVEYSDFQCPACSQRLETIRPLIAEFEQHIALVYRHYPIYQIHSNAQIAAQAAEAAGIQGDFWGMHDLLFDNQSEWKELQDQELQDLFIDYANRLGLDKETFRSDMMSEEVENLVKADYVAGNLAGVQGTPTFFLNGVEVPIGRYSEAKALIVEAIEANK